MHDMVSLVNDCTTGRMVLQPEKKSRGKKKSTSSKKSSGKKKGKAKSVKDTAAAKPPVVADPLSNAAMLNAYYIAHGPVQFLQLRGYKWEGGGTKKKKGKKKKK